MSKLNKKLNLMTCSDCFHKEVISDQEEVKAKLKELTGTDITYVPILPYLVICKIREEYNILSNCPLESNSG